ncbi:MAG: hypothetical protein ACRELU_08315 [Gemmatimonadota bacterium]
MRNRPHRYPIALLVLALGIIACQSDSPPTGPISNEPIVQNDPSPPGGDGSQTGDREDDPGSPPSTNDDPSPNDDQPDPGGDQGEDGADTAEDDPAGTPDDGPEEPGATPPPDPGEPEAPGEPEDPAPDPDDDLLAALDEVLQGELERLNALVPVLNDLYLDLLLTWVITLLQDTGELLACTPLPYGFDAAIVGPSGGKLVVGAHTLEIPAGALDRPVVIVAQSVPSLNIDMDLAPDGLSFQKPVSLTLSYGHCGGDVLGEPSFRIVYVRPNGDLEDRPSTDDKSKRRVTGWLDHFSRYAIAR